MLFLALLQVVSNPVTPSATQSAGSGRSSAQTVIYAIIAPVCSVEAASDTIVLDIASRGSQPATSLNYVCNNVDGLTRTIVSENGGILRRNEQGFAYFVSQTGAGDLGLARTQLSAPAISSIAGSPQLTTGSTGLLSVDIPALAPDLLAGDYRDTITVSIMPN